MVIHPTTRPFWANKHRKTKRHQVSSNNGITKWILRLYYCWWMNIFARPFVCNLLYYSYRMFMQEATSLVYICAYIFRERESRKSCEIVGILWTAWGFLELFFMRFLVRRPVPWRVSTYIQNWTLPIRHFKYTSESCKHSRLMLLTHIYILHEIWKRNV